MANKAIIDVTLATKTAAQNPYLIAFWALGRSDTSGHQEFVFATNPPMRLR